MALEDAILELAEAIRLLAGHRLESAQIDDESVTVARCMDAVGVPTTFKRRCSICGEIGRYASTHKEEMRDGTHHWVEVKA